jgi:hypothetical protein
MKAYYFIGAIVLLLAVAGYFGMGQWLLTDPGGPSHLWGSLPLVILILALIAFALADLPLGR